MLPVQTQKRSSTLKSCVKTSLLMSESNMRSSRLVHLHRDMAVVTEVVMVAMEETVVEVMEVVTVMIATKRDPPHTAVVDTEVITLQLQQHQDRLAHHPSLHQERLLQQIMRHSTLNTTSRPDSLTHMLLTVVTQRK